ncbi:MAG TPA: MBL fold metallo-hydrolase [Pyrinomonadaceae bacterium]|jgi:glyoxylase-like metal-dependent hydrolase (beta-lactamase superfamily II)/rhodanese-related sulfurtransferase
MNFKQFYLGCLAHASYYIGSGEAAAVVDPQRDVSQYVAEAEANGQKIKYVIETHLHADFVSGHVELARRTGAQIVFGEKAKAEFEHLAVKHGDELNLGRVKLKILETPGHTPEGISILVEDTENTGEPKKVLTGDTLFIGDVGRPDLAGGAGFTAAQMAEMLYDSLHEKLLSLSDDTEVYPAHGAGSLCGKNMSKETWSTLGEQRKFNYALQPMTKADFVQMLTAELPEAPAYFPKSAARNRAGASDLEEIEKPRAMTAEEIRDFQGLLLDVRSADDYGAGHIPNSLNIGLGGQFASWAGTLIEIGTPVVIVVESVEKVDEAAMRLARVGIESVRGYLEGGIEAWKNAGFEAKTIEQVSVREAQKRLAETPDAQFVDVRRSGEYESGHASKALNITLSDLDKLTAQLDRSRPTYVICQGGYRSSAATSILERKGFRELYNLAGGTAAWIKEGLETETETKSQAA